MLRPGMLPRIGELLNFPCVTDEFVYVMVIDVVSEMVFGSENGSDVAVGRDNVIQIVGRSNRI